MNKRLKILLIVIGLVIGLFKLTEWFLEYKFDALINKNPDRSYDISYEDFDLHTLFKGITLNKVQINPINKPKGTVIHGRVEYAELSGFKWARFIFSKSVDVQSLLFVRPEFNINVFKDSTKNKKDGNKMQGLFSDLLSRIDLSDFELDDGAIVVKQGDSAIIGEINSISIKASEIETDSVKFTHIIPFKLGNLDVKLDSAYYQINDYTRAQVGAIAYDISKESFSISDVSIKYDKDWVEISELRGLQDDVMQFHLEQLSVHQMNFNSSFWNDLDIEAKSMEIDSLSLSMMRNKNLPRPPEVSKPLLQGLVKKIPLKIDIDSIKIYNSKILYGELSKNRNHTGIIEVNDINGAITNFSTFEERQEAIQSFDINMVARLNDAADMHVKINVPYDEDVFALHTTLGPMNMAALSPSLIPLLGVEIKQGNLRGLDYKMNASFYQSHNHLVMDYEDLHLTVYKEEDDGSIHKQGFLSAIANTAIRHNNLPDQNKYIQASYTTQRNIYRSPIQHIVAGVLDGAKHIVPGKGIQSLINKDEKKKKKKSKKK